jgi:hypothetical protein
VYDGVIDAQFLTLHESASKRQRYSGDIYPSGVQLSKGEYVVRLLLRHDSHELLDKLKSLPLVMSRKLDTPGGPGCAVCLLVPRWCLLVQMRANWACWGAGVSSQGGVTTW